MITSAGASRAFHGHRRTTTTTTTTATVYRHHDDDDAVAAAGRWEKARGAVQEELFGDNRKGDDGGQRVAAVPTTLIDQTIV